MKEGVRFKANRVDLQKRKILVGLTTTDDEGWQKRVTEIDRLGLKEVALFLTCLIKKEREKIYKRLEKTCLQQIPFVHIRHDMSPQELQYLTSRFKTKIFNIHSFKEIPMLFDYSPFRKIIYIENRFNCFDRKEIKQFAGICLDFAHFENDRLTRPKVYQQNLQIIKEYSCGCNHISAIRQLPSKREREYRYDSHLVENFSELDYLKKYPASFFSEFIALELENSLTQQLKIKTYLTREKFF